MVCKLRKLRTPCPFCHYPALLIFYTIIKFYNSLINIYLISLEYALNIYNNINLKDVMSVILSVWNVV